MNISRLLTQLNTILTAYQRTRPNEVDDLYITFYTDGSSTLFEMNQFAEEEEVNTFDSITELEVWLQKVIDKEYIEYHLQELMTSILANIDNTEELNDFVSYVLKWDKNVR